MPPPDTRETLGQRVARLRRERGLSQPALALAAELSTDGIDGIEHGRRKNPQISTVRRLARALGVSLDTLLEGVEL